MEGNLLPLALKEQELNRQVKRACRMFMKTKLNAERQGNDTKINGTEKKRRLFTLHVGGEPRKRHKVQDVYMGFEIGDPNEALEDEFVDEEDEFVDED